MNTKKIVLFSALSLLAIIFVAENPIMFGFCQNVDVYNEGLKRCVEGGLFPEYIVQIGGFLSIILLSFSLITYFMRDEVFRAWWSFARWWVPVIIVVTILLNNANSGGGLGISGAVSTAFDILIIGILYAILIITSLVKIVRTFLKLRWEEKGISGDKLKDLNISLTAAIIAAIALILIAGWFVLLAL